MVRGRNYDDTIELFEAIEQEQLSGKTKLTYVSKGNYPANVEIATGTKALYYQEKGIGHVVTIEVRELSFTPALVVWNNNRITITSNVKVDGNGIPSNRGRYNIIVGAYKDERG